MDFALFSVARWHVQRDSSQEIGITCYLRNHLCPHKSSNHLTSALLSPEIKFKTSSEEVCSNTMLASGLGKNILWSQYVVQNNKIYCKVKYYIVYLLL